MNRTKVGEILLYNNILIKRIILIYYNIINIS